MKIDKQIKLIIKRNLNKNKEVVTLFDFLIHVPKTHYKNKTRTVKAVLTIKTS